MNVLTNFVKSMLIGGFFIVLPLLLIYLLLGEALEAVVGLAAPIADLFPEGTFDNAEAPVALAVVLIVLDSMAFGLTTHLAIARRLGGWLESQTIGRLPLYQTIKSLTSRFAAMEVDRFRPALIHGAKMERCR